MKKKIIITLLVLFFPFLVEASEKCVVVSGNGKNIGSEINCGGEHFYVIEEKEDSIRMLSKYNLNMGYEYSIITVSPERYTELKNICSGSSYCDETLNEVEFQNLESRYDINAVSEDENGNIQYFVKKQINNNGNLKQDEKAIGAHGDEKGKPQFPEYGVAYFTWFAPIDLSVENHYESDNMHDLVEDGIKIFEDTMLDSHLENYAEIMKNEITKLNILNIEMITLKDIDKIVLKLTNNNLPLTEWNAVENWILMTASNGYDYAIVGSIKEHLPSGYEWLYSTTYWTKTARFYDGTTTQSADLYFIDTLGNVCNSYACKIALGAGIRPVVEITKDSIDYTLTTKSDDNGELSTAIVHKEGDTIVLNSKPKTGYKLSKLIVTTDDGKTYEVSEKDIIENDDGTISINPELFVMPQANVIVEAKWELINPKTGVIDLITILFFGFAMSFCGFFITKKYAEGYQI